MTTLNIRLATKPENLLIDCKAWGVKSDGDLLIVKVDGKELRVNREYWVCVEQV